MYKPNSIPMNHHLRGSLTDFAKPKFITILLFQIDSRKILFDRIVNEFLKKIVFTVCRKNLEISKANKGLGDSTNNRTWFIHWVTVIEHVPLHILPCRDKTKGPSRRDSQMEHRFTAKKLPNTGTQDGKPIGSLGAGEAVWHTDMSYVDEPPMASVLYSLEIPPSGGDTSFANMVAALEALPDDLRAKIDGRIANHDSSYTSVGELRVGADPVTDVTKAPGARHPVIRTHPESGEKALYLGRRRNGWIVDMDGHENEALLDELWAHCADPRFAWTHQWRTGDLLIWDNRSLNHKREAFDPMSRRVMHRCQIKGDTPR